MWPDAECIWSVDDDALKVRHVTQHRVAHSWPRECQGELLDMERNAAENSSCFRVGVVSAKTGDADEAQMFENPMTERFADFLELFSDRVELQGWQGYRGQLSVTAPGTSYYTSWRKNEVMFHVAPLLNAEQQRRLLGAPLRCGVVLRCLAPSLTLIATRQRHGGGVLPRLVHGVVSIVCAALHHDASVRGGAAAGRGPQAQGDARFGECGVPRCKVVVALPLTVVQGGLHVAEEGGRVRAHHAHEPHVRRDHQRWARVVQGELDHQKDARQSQWPAQDFLLCRVINGYRAAVGSPPLDQMLRRPRAVALEELVKVGGWVLMSATVLMAGPAGASGGRCEEEGRAAQASAVTAQTR